MRKLRAALVDLSGTLHVGDAAMPGAQESLLRLRKLPLSIRFVTNTTKECRRDLHARLTRLGFALEPDEIFTSLSAARSLLEVRGLRPLLMLEDSALEDFQGVNTAEPNAVLVGLAPERFHYEAMNEAFRLVLEGAQLVAVHKARYYRRADGLALGPGPFVAALEYAAGVQALAVGKPEGPFFLEALRGLDCEPQQAVMIGDDARDDVAGAQRAGMRGILVKTGKYRDGDESRVDPGPHLTCPSFSDAVQVLEAEFRL
ncbi:haloacid dehalogenase-like hydrolase domain-containing protein 2 isoform X1 [Petromyzon marinus]|uniref:haloacid dehalogenase-like hydrolase domain-containing protein 2 isoform X1 n=1 Tax=Petromyzon marinus TaxID=7757 RepID=UPI003F6ED340